MCILEESRRIITNRCRNDLEYGTKTTNAHANRTRAAPISEGEMDVRVIRSTIVSRSESIKQMVRMPHLTR